MRKKINVDVTASQKQVNWLNNLAKAVVDSDSPYDYGQVNKATAHLLVSTAKYKGITVKGTYTGNFKYDSEGNLKAPAKVKSVLIEVKKGGAFKTVFEAKAIGKAFLDDTDVPRHIDLTGSSYNQPSYGVFFFGAMDIFGGMKNDVFKGGRGNDVMLGNEGNDKFFGRAGKDVFKFGDGFGKDVIADFENNKDTIELWNDKASGYSGKIRKLLNDFGHQDGKDFILQFAPNEKLTIKNATKNQLVDDIDVMGF